MTAPDLREPALERLVRPPLRMPLVRGLDLGADPVVPAGTPRKRRPLLGDRTVLLGLLTVVGVVLAAGATRWPGLQSDDEGTYVAQAWAVLRDGSLAHYTYWYDHPPLGWIQLAGLDALLGGLVDTGSSVTDGRVLVLLPSLVTLGLLYPLGLRLGLRRPAAAAAVLLLGLSPLALNYLRSVHLDTLALPWLLGAFVLAATPRRSLWAHAGSGLCFAVAVLTKETLLVVLPALALLVWQRTDPRTRAFAVTAFTVVLASVGLAYPLYAVLKGELLPGPDHVSLWAAIEFQLVGRETTGSVLDPASPSGQLLQGWLSVDPWLLGLGLALLPVGLVVRRLRSVALAGTIIALVALRPGYLPGMYVLALLPFAAVVVAGVADAAVGRLRGTRGPALARPVAALAGIAALLALVAPSWAQGLRTATTTDPLQPHRSAVAYLERNVDPTDRVLVDDNYYVDLVELGLEERTGAVWFFKVDAQGNPDPTILDELPGGWRAFDYVVSTSAMRSALDSRPGGLVEAREAIVRSEVVASWGTGEERIEVRRVLKGSTGAP